MDKLPKCAVFVIALCTSAPATANQTAGPGIPGLQRFDAPQFPAALRGTSIGDGYATVAFTIDADGHVDDAVTVAASHAAFGEAVLEVLPSWELVPQPSETIPRREVIHVNFKRRGVISTASHYDAVKSAFAATTAAEAQIRVMSWERLETPPRRLTAVRPAVSKSLSARLAGAHVQVNFVIDGQGRVRVPAVTATVEPQLATAILGAVKQWRFTPPTHRAKPIMVEVTHSFALEPAAK